MINKKVKLIDNSVDNFREALGKSWTSYNNSSDSNKLRYNIEQSAPQFDYEIHPPTVVESQENSPHFSQKLNITSYSRQFQSIDDWRDYLGTLFPINTPVSDHHIEIALPEQLKAGVGFQFGQNTSTYRIEPRYSYIAENYENHVRNLNELTLPNIYICDSPMMDSFEGFRPFRKGKPSRGRFENFTKKERSTFASNMDPNYFNKMTNVVIGSGYKMSKAQAVVSQYPYDIKLAFTQPQQSKKIFNFIHNLGIYPFLLNDVIDNGGSLATFRGSFAGDSSNLVDSVNFQLIDILEWSKGESYNYNQTNKLYYGNEQYKSKSSYATSFMGTIFNGFLNDLIKEHMRGYEEIIDGATCMHETLFYQVEKFKDVVIGQPLQTFWIPAKSNSVSYIDTQLKYDNLYAYRVSAYIMIVGNNYSFTSVDNVHHNERTGLFTASVSMENRCSMKIVKVPYFQEQARVMNPPPSIPMIDFYNRSNSKNMINIRMALTSYHGTGEYEIITSDDSLIKTKLEQFYKNQDPKSIERPENYIGTFEVFRASTPPKSYTDFSQYRLIEITSESNTTSQVFEDRVLPNTKYYYCFRSVNHHGIRSQPTKVMEVQLIKDADDSKVEVNVYEFPKADTFQKTTTMKRFFQIMPSQNQSYFNPDQNSIYGAESLNNKLDNINLGMAEKSIWGRKMKIRLTSTDTGRKIDFNITFDLIKEKSEE